MYMRECRLSVVIDDKKEHKKRPLRLAAAEAIFLWYILRNKLARIGKLGNRDLLSLNASGSVAAGQLLHFVQGNHVHVALDGVL